MLRSLLPLLALAPLSAQAAQTIDCTSREGTPFHVLITLQDGLRTAYNLKKPLEQLVRFEVGSTGATDPLIEYELLQIYPGDSEYNASGITFSAGLGDCGRIFEKSGPDCVKYFLFFPEMNGDTFAFGSKATTVATLMSWCPSTQVRRNAEMICKIK
jgi:hypothetical protein